MVSAKAHAIDPNITPETTINCALPTLRENNEPLLPGEIVEIRFYTSLVSGNYTSTPANTTTGICQWVIDNTAQPEGTLYIVVTAVDNDGRESKHSLEKEHVIAVKLPPASPTWLEDS
jgi:hypothetical protein